MQALDIPFYQSNILLLVSLTVESSSSLYQDVSHGFDFTVSLIWTTAGLVTKRVALGNSLSCAKLLL